MRFGSARLRMPLVAAVAVAAVVALPATAMANDGGHHEHEARHQEAREREHHRNGTFSADLDRVKDDPQASNFSNANGDVRARLVGDQLEVWMTVRGLSPNLPHVAHIHGVLGRHNVCPPASAQKLPPVIVPGIIDTVQGQPSYGPILVTLTTSGDTSPGSALDVTRAPMSDAHGVVHYHRVITLPHQVAEDLGELHIVMHGRDLNMNHTYDGVQGSLAAGVPLEAEMPVTCGGINR